MAQSRKIIVVQTNSRDEDSPPQQQVHSSSSSSSPPVSLKKRVRYEVSLAYRNLMNWLTGSAKRHEIIPHLILGQIPTVMDAKELLAQYPNLKCVVSVTELFELKGKTLFIDPNIQSPVDWAKAGVNHYVLPIEDFSAEVDAASVYKIIKKMHEYISQEKDVYIHCKAGVGRSAMICACYLGIYGSGDGILEPGRDANEIRNFIFSKRNLINLDADNLKKISEVIQYHENSERSLDRMHADAPTLLEKLHYYCGSAKGINAIRQLPEIIELEKYGKSKSNSYSQERSKLVENFIQAISTANDASWVIELLSGKGNLQSLLDRRPHGGIFGVGKPKVRQELVDHIKDALKTLFIKELNCDEDDLLSLSAPTEIRIENVTLNIL